MYNPFSLSAPDEGRILILTGQNGSGKTRAMGNLADELVGMLDQRTETFNRIICLSGTIIDRFPRAYSDNASRYVYCGKKTNNNMFSEIAPFRVILDHMLRCRNWRARALAAKDAFSKIGLDSSIGFKFRRGRNTSIVISAVDTLLEINLAEEAGRPRAVADISDLLSAGAIHLSNLIFKKNDVPFDLAELSSGERGYALMILALAFSISDNSFVLYDEPENSLHPSWQSSITNDIWSLIDRLSSGSKLVIATHSPLIISGASNNVTWVRDLESSEDWVRSDMYGKSSDSILLEQFGVRSPRAMSFVRLINECLRAALYVGTEPRTFSVKADELLALGVVLDAEDPLYETLEEIKTIREELQ